MNKTGSTSIQRTFQNYADDDRIYLNLGDWNHSRILVVAFASDPQRGFLRSNDVGAEREAARQSIAEALSADMRSVVVSGEELSTYASEQLCSGLLDFFGQHVDEIRALAYVRDPYSFVSSAFQQRVRTWPHSVNLSDYAPNYRERFQPWLHAVGDQGLSLVPFDRAEFAEGNLLIDFAQRVGFARSYALTHAFQANPALSAEVTALFYALHRWRSAGRICADDPSDRRRTVWLLMDFGSNRFAFSRAALAQALAPHRDDIAWVEEALGWTFDEPAADPPGHLVFDGAEDLLDYAESLGPELRQYLSGKLEGTVPATDDAATLLEAAISSLA
jgi:hypothetical protein